MRGFQITTHRLPTTTTSQDIEDWVNLKGRGTRQRFVLGLRSTVYPAGKVDCQKVTALEYSGVSLTSDA
eukprot:scaffold6705_cov90-Skeletonema_dohrnii-CCMP3373.AAC.3